MCTHVSGSTQVDGKGASHLRPDRAVVVVAADMGSAGRENTARQPLPGPALRTLAAVEALASHDYAAIEATGAATEQLRQARTTALALCDRHWPAILAAGALLERNDRVSSETLSALLHQPPGTASPTAAQTLSPPVAFFSHFMDRASQIAAESQQRDSRTPDATAQPPHAQSEALSSQQPGHRHIR
ncbi:hypothetical protein ACIQF5_21840 [Streptomyces goshikiensis]|uniref:hypothetical protein n=1 Tax=Streptomyces goshikiensis TaxID=1942 RepID=UPI0038114385